MRLAAFEHQPSADSALENVQHRRSSVGLRMATRSGDRRLRANKSSERHAIAGREEKLDKMRTWESACDAHAVMVVRGYQARLAGSSASVSLSGAHDIEFVPGAEGTELAALVSPEREPAGLEHVLEEEEVDAIAALLLG